MRRFYRFHAITLGVAVLTVSVSVGAEKSSPLLRTNVDLGATRRDDDIQTKPSLELGRAVDVPRLFNRAAELEATDVFFTFDFHFGTDTAHSHRVEAVITNLDTSWSGSTRTWEIYRIPPGGYPYGITLVDDGTIPAIAPGDTYEFWRSLPSNVNINNTYVLILSAGDANRDNDFAVDQP